MVDWGSLRGRPRFLALIPDGTFALLTRPTRRYRKAHYAVLPCEDAHRSDSNRGAIETLLQSNNLFLPSCYGPN